MSYDQFLSLSARVCGLFFLSLFLFCAFAMLYEICLAWKAGTFPPPKQIYGYIPSQSFKVSIYVLLAIFLGFNRCFTTYLPNLTQLGTPDFYQGMCMMLLK